MRTSKKQMHDKICYLFVVFILFVKYNTYFYEISLFGSSSIKDKFFVKMFIMRTFFYPRGYLVGKGDAPTTVTIVNIENVKGVEADTFLDVRCIVHSNRTRLPSTRQETAKVVTLYDAKYCKLVTYALVCRHEKGDVGGVNLRILTGSKLLLKKSASSPVLQLAVAPSDGVKRTLLLCMSRVFLFERWQMLVTAMELYRQQKVDTVVAYILSVHPAIFELMRLYEREGLLKFRPNTAMLSKVRGMDYNPNTETEWNSQGVDFHDCLYEFRENTEFIVFIDWDDFLVSPTFQPLPVVFQHFAHANQMAASFVVQRFTGYLPSTEQMSASNMTLRELWEEGFLFDKSTLWSWEGKVVGKLVVRPKLVESVHLHRAIEVSSGHKANMEFPLEHAITLHIRKEQPFVPIDKMVLDSSELEYNFEKMLTGRNSKTAGRDLMQRLPKRETNRLEFFKCYKHMEKYVARRTRENPPRGKGQCGNVKMCGEISQFSGMRECVLAQNRWHFYAFGRSGLAIAMLESSEFRHAENCSYTY